MTTILMGAAVIGCTTIMSRIILDGALGMMTMLVAVETLRIAFVGMFPVLAVTLATVAPLNPQSLR